MKKNHGVSKNTSRGKTTGNDSTTKISYSDFEIRLKQSLFPQILKMEEASRWLQRSCSAPLLESLARLQAVYKSQLEVATFSLTKPLFDAASSFQRQLFSNAWKGFAYYLRVFDDNPTWYSSLHRLAERLRRKTRERVILVLRKYEWWITPSLPLTQLEAAVLAGAKGRDISLIIKKHFRDNSFRNLNKMIRSWSKSPLIKSRLAIIKQALRAHKCGDYGASIATLLPQVEGVANDYINRNPELKKKIKEQDMRSPKRKVKEAISEGLIAEDELAKEVLLAYIEESAYQKTNPGEITKRAFNRHKILHGEQLRYGTEANSLRALLLIDALSALKLPARGK